MDRGFDRAEYQARMGRAQAEMTARQLDAVVVTAPPNWRYFAGFATQFWESPTRPWFLVLPRQGEPVAVIPTIGEPGVAGPGSVTSAPGRRRARRRRRRLMAGVLGALPRRFGRIGWEMGRESVIRMPITDFDRHRAGVRGHRLRRCIAADLGPAHGQVAGRGREDPPCLPGRPRRLRRAAAASGRGLERVDVAACSAPTDPAGARCDPVHGRHLRRRRLRPDHRRPGPAHLADGACSSSISAPRSTAISATSTAISAFGPPDDDDGPRP